VLSPESWVAKREAAWVAADARWKSAWKWRARWTEERDFLKEGLRSHLRRMAGVGQSEGAGPVGLERKERRKVDWALVVPSMRGISGSLCESYGIRSGE
jgi:transposase